MLTGADSVVMVKDTIPVMKDTMADVCRCNSAKCNCIRNGMASLPSNGVVGLPLDFNIQNLLKKPVYSLENDLMNGLHIQALITSSAVNADAYASEIFSRNWAPYQSLVTSSDQITNPRNPGKRKKLVDETPISSSIIVNESERRKRTGAPISPLISTSSPATKNRAEIPAKKFVCKECSKSFDYKHVLQNHVRTHTGEKPFKCEACDKRFTRDHHLKTHMRLHTGEKPFVCQYCDMRFVQVANLRRHIRIHKCGICQSAYRDVNQLRIHLLAHAPHILPQTEPEDLSVRKYRSINNNNSSSSTGDSSRSPSSVEDLSSTSPTET